MKLFTYPWPPDISWISASKVLTKADPRDITENRNQPSWTVTLLSYWNGLSVTSIFQGTEVPGSILVSCSIICIAYSNYNHSDQNLMNIMCTYKNMHLFFPLMSQHAIFCDGTQPENVLEKTSFRNYGQSGPERHKWHTKQNSHLRV
jgi:hypothetical protein